MNRATYNALMVVREGLIRKHRADEDTVRAAILAGAPDGPITSEPRCHGCGGTKRLDTGSGYYCEWCLEER